jgi:hypothetical protein
MTFIPGWQATVTLNSEDISAVGSVLSLNLARNVMAKPVFGAEYTAALGGQRAGTFTASGHVSAEKIAALNTMFEVDASIAYSIQIGTAASATDGGTYTGNCAISSFEITGNADGEWDWSIAATTDSTITYTPASS